jgi:hypothetical protein
MTEPIDNGGITSEYIWQQTAYDVTITFPNKSNPPISSKNIKISMKPNHLVIKMNNDTTFEGQFTEPIKCESSCWFLDENKNVVIEADKFKKHSWWKSAFIGHDEIDTTKVTPASESFSDLDSSTKSTISKMLYEQEMKEKLHQI